ncbi:Hypothetical protein A7982_03077 [Minicystis rosea]|nr:Hypothetical protein A7982_03077 [Minicystis rosea]
MSKIKDANACTNDDPPKCTSEGIAWQRDANTSANVSNASLAIGGAALITGVVLFATASPKKPVTVGRAQLSIEPMVGPGTAALSIQGAW